MLKIQRKRRIHCGLSVLDDVHEKGVQVCTVGRISGRDGFTRLCRPTIHRTGESHLFFIFIYLFNKRASLARTQTQEINLPTTDDDAK